MDAQLRERLENSRFYQAEVLEVAALLPASDEELRAQIAETVAARDQWGFVILTTAALHAGRRVDAEHLVGGTILACDPTRLGNFAWKMEGDVPGAILAAMQRSALPRPAHAAALFVVAAWCAERRGGELPPGFAAEARHLARLENLHKDALAYLSAAAHTAKDEGLRSVLRQKYPHVVSEALAAATENFITKTLKYYAGAAMDIVPETPPKELARGRTMRRAVEKLSRNALCHCGSGRKYKRCCFEKDQERLHLSTDVTGRTRAELLSEPEADLTEPRIKKMMPFEIERIDPRKIPETLQGCYLMQVTGLQLLDRAVEFLEVTDWNEERKEQWGFVLFFVVQKQRKDLAERMVALHTRHETIKELREGVSLLLARDDPSEELRVLADTAMMIFAETVPEKLSNLGYGVLSSRHTALGIIFCRSLLPILPSKHASSLLKAILEARDRLNLPPDDSFSDVLEKRLAEETPDEGADAAALRAARKRLDAKAAEVRDLTEKIERQRRELERREKKQQAGPQPEPHATVDDAELREMRIKLDQLKGALHERAAERTDLRRELEKARDDLEALRRDHPGPAPADDAADDEAAHYLPEQPAGNQPIRLIEFPHKFRENLEDLPRHAARAALAMIGRLAGGEPAAFAGVVQLKDCPTTLRVRIGSEHRLLFRLHPDRVQVLDLINRRDLDRKIKALRAAG